MENDIFQIWTWLFSSETYLKASVSNEKDKSLLLSHPMKSGLNDRLLKNNGDRELHWYDPAILLTTIGVTTAITTANNGKKNMRTWLLLSSWLEREVHSLNNELDKNCNNKFNSGFFGTSKLILTRGTRIIIPEWG